MNEGRTKLDSIIEKLKQELVTVETELKLSNVKIDEMNSVKEKLDSSGDPVDCDEAVTATAPVFKQLLQGRYFSSNRNCLLCVKKFSSCGGRGSRGCSIFSR